MKYKYYVRLSYPDFPDPEWPMAIYRMPNGEVLSAEALDRDGVWRWAEQVVRSFMFGDTMTVEEVDEEIAQRAIKNLMGMIKARGEGD